MPIADPILFDSHAHLQADAFDADRDAVLERARAAGVRYVAVIGSGYGADAFRAAVDLAEGHDGIWATVGVHPHDARQATEGTWAELEPLLASPSVVAVGEIGLDFHYDLSPRDVQRQVFEHQLELAVRHGLPVSLHVREAAPETLELLERARGRLGEAVRGVWHCFTEGEEEARRAIELGFHVSIPGIVTFKNATRLRDAVRELPLDRLLVETDSPYLAPVPHRGKRNEPAYVVATVECVAELRGEPASEIARATARNAFVAYGLEVPDGLAGGAPNVDPDNPSCSR